MVQDNAVRESESLTIQSDSRIPRQYGQIVRVLDNRVRHPESLTIQSDRESLTIQTVRFVDSTVRVRDNTVRQSPRQFRQS